MSPHRTTDHAHVLMPPPIAWALICLAGFGLRWLLPLPFLPAAVPGDWLGFALFIPGFVLALSAAAAISLGGSPVQPHHGTTAIVTGGPYRVSRNPIYLGILLCQAGFAAVFDSFWLLAGLVPLYLILRHGVVAREEAYLERKFGATYLDYKARVRRWL